jgi:hypothetical protein
MSNGGHDPEALSVWASDLVRDGLRNVLPQNIARDGLDGQKEGKK